MKFTRNEVLTGSIIGTISFALLSGTVFDLGLIGAAWALGVSSGISLCVGFLRYSSLD